MSDFVEKFSWGNGLSERATIELQEAFADLRAEVESLKAQLAHAEQMNEHYQSQRNDWEGHFMAAEEQLRVAREALEPFRDWPTVYEFALAMIEQLNHHKPRKGGREGWSKDDPRAILRRVEQETEELEGSLGAFGNATSATLDEAADVGNMAMMVADAAGAIKGAPLAALSDSTPKVAESCSAYYARGEKCPCELLAMHPPKEPTKAETGDTCCDGDGNDRHEAKCPVGRAMLDEQQRQVLATDAKLVDACPKPCRADLMRVAKRAWDAGYDTSAARLPNTDKEREQDCAAIVAEVSR